MRSSTISVLAAILLVVTAGPAVAQNPVEMGQTYMFDAAVPVTECGFDGAKNPGSSAVLAPRTAKFIPVNEGAWPASAERPEPTSILVIQFLDWARSNPYRMVFNEVAGDSLSRRTFCVERSAFDRLTTRIFDTGLSSWDLAAGVLVLPIKMRLAGDDRPFDFSRDVTLGTVVGPRIRITPVRDVYLSALFGAGVTAVTLTEENTSGTLAGSTDRAAVTLTAGLMLDVQRFQIGVMMGSDRISEPNQADWIYQGKPWFSIGLGYTLLSTPRAAPQTGSQ